MVHRVLGLGFLGPIGDGKPTRRRRLTIREPLPNAA